MIIYPGQSRAAPRQDSQPVTPEVLASIVLELAPLGQIGHWEPVAKQLSELSEALKGAGSITRRELDRLRNHAALWGKLDTRLRAFYADHLSDPTARVALYRVLNGGPQLQHWQRRKLAELWIQDFGVEPSMTLAPIKSRSAR